MTIHDFAHWRDVPAGLWRWPNFSPEEIACRSDGTIRVNEAALDRLQALRDRLARPIIVHSAYRSPDYNRKVGGAPRSQHLLGAAFDISMANHDPHAFEAAAREAGFTGFGYYPPRTSCTSTSAPCANGASGFPKGAAVSPRSLPALARASPTAAP
ncbi:D-Ala-D-Ala carboxypeptidase family metallohydrolase [Jhaorihella thermophila]